VVIDAAAGFDSLTPGSAPAVVSLHATKVFGTGEGGFVASTDPALRDAVHMRANFGFSGSRQAKVGAYNAKLSEYHAADGHAGLDEWTEARVEWVAAAKAYRRMLGRSNQINFQAGFGEEWITSTCVLSFAQPVADQIEHALAESNVETR